MDKKVLKKLHKIAKKQAQLAYCPYSKVHVGAALLTATGEMIGGSNVENISYGATICAERAAFCKAVSDGHRKFKAVYLYTKEQWAPCGMCLQFMSEFITPDTPIVLGSDGKVSIVSLQDLLPKAVDLATFKKLQR